MMKGSVSSKLGDARLVNLRINSNVVMPASDKRQVVELPGKARRSRRFSSPGKARTAILKAARELFAKQGFRGTTMQAIGRRAGVDIALIAYYFQSKSNLFAAAIDLPISAERLRGLFINGGNSRGSGMARLYLERLFLDGNEAIAATLRAGLGDPGCVPALPTLIEKTLAGGAIGALQGTDERLRVEIFGALMVGLFISRHIVGVEPLVSAPIDAIVAILGPAIDSILDGKSMSPEGRG